MLFEYPSESDWERIARTFPCRKLDISLDDFGGETDSIKKLLDYQELQAWAIHLQNRLIDVFKSYVFLMYYYEKGIPDTEWYISPGKKGQSIQYFPHFEVRHFLIKDQFDFYADIFYYKIFSAWDTIGHLLKTLFELKDLSKPTFKSVVNQLEQKKPDLYRDLKLIINNPDFKQANEIRNNVTHNFLPGHQDSGIAKSSKNKITLGVGKYTPSTTIKSNVAKALELFEKTLEHVKTQTKK